MRCKFCLSANLYIYMCFANPSPPNQQNRLLSGDAFSFSLTTLLTSLLFPSFFFFLAPRGAARRGAPRRAPRGKNQKKKKRKKEREVTRVVRERGISTQLAMSFVASASSRVSRVNFAACRDLISACLSANFGAIRRVARLLGAGPLRSHLVCGFKVNNIKGYSL